MSERLGARGRITIGFLPVALLAALLCLGLIRALGGFAGYAADGADVLRQGAAVAALRADVAALRKTALDYDLSPSETAASAFEAAAATARKQADDTAALLAGEAHLQPRLAAVRADLDRYAGAFSDYAGLHAARQDAVTKLEDAGPLASGAMADVMLTAWRAFDIEALYQATQTFDSLNQGLYSSERAIQLRDAAAAKTVEAKLAETLGRYDAMVKIMTDPPQLERAKAALTLIKDFQTAFGEADQAGGKIGALREAVLTGMPAALDKSLASVGQTIADTEAGIAPAEHAYADRVAIGAAAACLILILVGLLCAQVTGRLLGRRVRSAADLVSRIGAGGATEEMSAAMLAPRHEFGALARALNELSESRGKAESAAETEAATARDTALREQAAREAAEAEANRRNDMLAERLGDALARLADGDLTARVEPGLPDPHGLGERFNSAVENLDEALGTIIPSLGTIRAGIGEIAVAADDLSRRTEQQAANLEQTVAALGEVTGRVGETARGAGRADTAAGTAKEKAERGGEIVGRAVSAMASIQQSSEKIGKILGVIDEIAFQTNLLALNAGVEAARAGEAGRGFAVVAQEVRGLAQRSADAAKEIKALIAASREQVDAGVRLVSQSGQSLEEIVADVSEMSRFVAEIASSAKDQATNLREVSVAADQMDTATQQNAAMVEETTAAAAQLRTETERVMALVKSFRTNGSAVQEEDEEAERPVPARTPAAARPPVPQKPVARWTPPAAIDAPKKPAKVRQLRSTGSSARKATEAEDGWEEF
ncbi:methyl-accepting chemotaxis protein [Jiella sp. M17.18]|uniref:methyl-accepting chemotaxis protein n=1 Tax=Jiella sp. M17.18 TaxID=3234247 RepID=UPI0034DE37BD